MSVYRHSWTVNIVRQVSKLIIICWIYPVNIDSPYCEKINSYLYFIFKNFFSFNYCLHSTTPTISYDLNIRREFSIFNLLYLKFCSIFLQSSEGLEQFKQFGVHLLLIFFRFLFLISFENGKMASPREVASSLCGL